jgi:hypothetical protein
MSNVNYSIVMDSKDWEKKANALAKRGSAFTKDFSSFVHASVVFFYGEGNRNVEIINGLVSIAYDSRGMNASHLIDYLANLIPHKVVKDKENGKRFLFAGKKKGEEYDELGAMVWLDANPVWTEWGGMDKAPKAWNPEAAIHALLVKAEKEGKLVEVKAMMREALAA